MWTFYCDSWNCVDFGGGYTEGQINKKITSTAEGDLQGLTNILEYLDI